MKTVYASVAYIRRKTWNFWKTQWHYQTKLVGIALLADDGESLRLYNRSLETTKEERKTYAIMLHHRPGGCCDDDVWRYKDDLAREVSAFMSDNYIGRIITDGDPHVAALIDDMLRFANLGGMVYDSIEQRMYDASMWLPQEAYGAASGFDTYYPRPEHHSYSEEQRREMYESHSIFPPQPPKNGTEYWEHKYNLRQQVWDLRNKDHQIGAVFNHEIERMLKRAAMPSMEWMNKNLPSESNKQGLAEITQEANNRLYFGNDPINESNNIEQ